MYILEFCFLLVSYKIETWIIAHLHIAFRNILWHTGDSTYSIYFWIYYIITILTYGEIKIRCTKDLILSPSIVYMYTTCLLIHELYILSFCNIPSKETRFCYLRIFSYVNHFTFDYDEIMYLYVMIHSRRTNNIVVHYLLLSVIWL